MMTTAMRTRVRRRVLVRQLVKGRCSLSRSPAKRPATRVRCARGMRMALRVTYGTCCLSARTRTLWSISWQYAAVLNTCSRCYVSSTWRLPGVLSLATRMMTVVAADVSVEVVLLRLRLEPLHQPCRS